jgi:hypothetical protein
VDTVITDVAPLCPGVTLDGEKPHDALLGRPEQESATAELNTPPTGLAVKWESEGVLSREDGKSFLEESANRKLYRGRLFALLALMYERAAASSTSRSWTATLNPPNGT